MTLSRQLVLPRGTTRENFIDCGKLLREQAIGIQNRAKLSPPAYVNGGDTCFQVKLPFGEIRNARHDGQLLVSGERNGDLATLEAAVHILLAQEIPKEARATLTTETIRCIELGAPMGRGVPYLYTARLLLPGVHHADTGEGIVLANITPEGIKQLLEHGITIGKELYARMSEIQYDAHDSSPLPGLSETRA